MIYVSLLDCYWLLAALLEYTMHGNMPPVIEDSKSSVTTADIINEKPLRREGKSMFVYFIET